MKLLHWGWQSYEEGCFLHFWTLGGLIRTPLDSTFIQSTIQASIFELWDGTQRAQHNQTGLGQHRIDLLGKQSKHMCFLTIYTSIIHQNDFFQQNGRWRIKHTVDSSKQRGPCFIMKDYYDTGGGQGRTSLKFLFNTSRSQRGRRVINFITLLHSCTITRVIII